MKKALVAILIIMALAACRRQGKVAEGVQPFDEMHRLVLEQQTGLAQRKSPVNKIILLNGDTSRHTYSQTDWSNDSMFWIKELATLLSIEGKPGWDKLYRKTTATTIYPPLSTINREVYLPTDTALPYKSISIARDSAGHMLGFDFTEVRKTPVYLLNREVSFMKDLYLNTRTVQHTVLMGTDTIITQLPLN